MPQQNMPSDIKGAAHDVAASTVDAASSAAATAKKAVENVTSRAKEGASELGSLAGDTLHTGRLSTANAFDKAAKGLSSAADSVGAAGHDAADAVQEAGHSAADKLNATAKYVRSHGAKDIMSDVQELVKGNPGKSMIAAVAAGFLLGRSLSRRD